jgi:alkylation response protein AidB-like acyl-CoA dehydrogenase
MRTRSRPVERDLPNDDARDLIELARDVADRELAPRAAKQEAIGAFPQDAFGLLATSGLMSLAVTEPCGGSQQPYVVYLQVLEEIAARWVTVALGMSVHTLACYAIQQLGTGDQQESLAASLDGGALGAYCLSEVHAGSDPAALRASAIADSDGSWRLNGTKAWITHGGHADFYTSFLRTSDDHRRGISCFHIPAVTPGIIIGRPENKMGLAGSPTTTVTFDDALLPSDALVAERGMGLQIALSALDAGRLGISAIAVGLAQAALDYAVDYAIQRTTFGRAIIEHQGLAFLLADMAAAVESARATYLAAARRKDLGLDFGRQASIAKLVATDAAMMVTTEAVQVLGGAGYLVDHPVERFMREAKVMQIFEGTNQIQRIVIGRKLADERGARFAVRRSPESEPT